MSKKCILFKAKTQIANANSRFHQGTWKKNHVKEDQKLNMDMKVEMSTVWDCKDYKDKNWTNEPDEH